MARYILEHVPGVYTQYVMPDEDGFTIETEWHDDKVLEHNAALRSVNTEAPKGDQTLGHLVASIPMSVYEQWCRENPELAAGTPEGKAWLMAKLRDRDYSKLKTYDGSI